VLTSDRILAPAYGFKTGDAKEAFAEAKFVPPASLPTGPSSASGYPVISAADALAMLDGSGTPLKGGSGTISPLVITGVQLGTGSFSTDRGWQTLPAWLFTLGGVQNPAAVLAVAPSAIFTPSSVPRGLAGIAAKRGNSGQTLTVIFTGAAPGPGPCTADYTAEVAESATAVAVAIHAIPQTATTTGPEFCTDVGYDRQVTVTLAAPLGGRVLVDDSGRPASLSSS
jgi:hypothetical protein